MKYSDCKSRLYRQPKLKGVALGNDVIYNFAVTLFQPIVAVKLKGALLFSKKMSEQNCSQPLCRLYSSDVNKATTHKAKAKTKNGSKRHSSHLIKAWHCLSC